jgi:nucleotide-binding universal stress UspA family protein
LSAELQRLLCTQSEATTYCVLEANIMFHHLLLPLDGSALAECALPHTLAFAHAFNTKVTLLRVLPAHPSGVPVDVVAWQLQIAEAEAYLDKIAARLQTAGIPAERVVVEGQPANAIIECARRNQVDLVVLCSHGASGLADWHIGGVAQKVLFRSYLSSLLIRACQPIRVEETDLRYRRILAPLDGSLRAECMLPFAASLARAHGAQLLLAHVFRRPEMPRRIPVSSEDLRLADQLVAHNRAYMIEHLEQVRSRLPAGAEVHLLEGDDVAAALHEFALSEQVDLVVMSAHGHVGGNHWPYGSVATNFIVYGATPLLLIQDLPETGYSPTPVEVAMRDLREHVYMASERFQPTRSERLENAVTAP